MELEALPSKVAGDDETASPVLSRPVIAHRVLPRLALTAPPSHHHLIDQSDKLVLSV